MPHGLAMYHDGLLRQVDAKCLGMEKPLFGVAFFVSGVFVGELGVGCGFVCWWYEASRLVGWVLVLCDYLNV